MDPPLLGMPQGPERRTQGSKNITVQTQDEPDLTFSEITTDLVGEVARLPESQNRWSTDLIEPNRLWQKSHRAASAPFPPTLRWKTSTIPESPAVFTPRFDEKFAALAGARLPPQPAKRVPAIVCPANRSKT